MYQYLRTLISIPVLMLLICPCFCTAQDLPNAAADKINSSIAFQYKNYPREKIFVHTNAQVYTAGQTIWYKIYAQAYGKPSVISKIVYVQMSDSSGNIVAQNKLPLVDGIAHGNIDLSPKLPTGWYQLRSFTVWMMNFGTEGFFKSRIFIQQGADTVKTHPVIKSAVKYTIAFYPEGGDPLTNNECNFAFKATGPDGKPAFVHGEVIDDTKQKVADMITVHDGMGKFSLQGYAGKNYKAIVQFPDNSKQVVALPAFRMEGVTMSVTQRPDALSIKMAYAGSKDEYGDVFFAAYQDNGRIAVYPLQMGRGISVFEFKKSLFATGMLRLTIFDHNYIPLAERVVFIDNHDAINFNLNADTLSFQPKGKNAFTIGIKKSDTAFRQGNFSVSVRDYKTTDTDEQYSDNISSSLLVSSELRGSLYHPGYYFQNDADSLKEQLDLVMLTNGWRHFNWDTVLNKVPHQLKYAPERTQYLAGRIMSNENLQNMQIKLIIMNQDSSKFIGFIKPDSAGQFILPEYEHSGISNLYVELADKKNHIKKSAVKLLNTFADSLQRVKSDLLSDTQPLKANVIKNIRSDTAGSLHYGKLLKTVIIHEQKITPTDELINQHVGPLYHSDREFTFDFVNNPPPFMGVLDYLKGRIPGLRILGWGDSITFIYRGDNTLMTSKKGTKIQSLPYFYVNEAPTTDLEMIEDLDINEVAMIRFMPPPVGFAPYNGGNVGALMIYLKDNVDEKGKFASREKFDQYTFNGYTITREFASPDYSLPQNRSGPDARSTLYWQPELKTDATGKAHFSFYNSDVTKGYIIIIQGMNSEGHLGYLYRVIH